MEKDINVTTFNNNSHDYHHFRPTYPEALFRYLSDICTDHVTAWDCACGTGQVSKSLINYFQNVHATDINQNQINNGYKKDSIYYSLQSSEDTNFDKNSFDLVCVAQAMHWFDLPKYFKEVKRVLKYNGIFACFGYGFFKIEPEIDRLINSSILEPIKPFWSEKNKILTSGYEGVDFPFKRLESPEIDMIEYWTKEELVNYIKTWSAYKLYQKESKIDICDHFIGFTDKIWPMNFKKSIKMDFILYIGQNIQ